VSVEARVETITIPTYQWGPEDPNPPFQRRAYWNIYPYSLMDDLGEEARPVEYRAVVLENGYLRLIVLPELGGRLYSALDKPTGREIFYRNHVVKPGLIALRGAWISGGIEFNFPRGHTVTTVSPVDSRLVEEEDGAVTVWVGNLERVFRMGWAVGIRLRPESALVETEIRLTNRQDLPHPFYFWANASVPARKDMRLVYPATKVRVWSNVLNWPIHEGRNLATYFAHDYQGDIFALDSLEDFFGAHYPELDFGLVHVADVHDAYGKKFFTWGTWDHGKMWAEVLSDGDGPYCELQSGRFVDQGVWRMFPPHHTIQWTEHWYAVKGIGGFAWANQEAAVRLNTADGNADLGVLVTRPMPDALVRLTAGDRIVHEQRLSLSPDRPLRKTVPINGTGSQPVLTLTLLDCCGCQIIRYTEDQPPRTITLPHSSKRAGKGGESTSRAAAVSVAGRATGDLLQDARRAEERGAPEEARALYERVLADDPACVEAAVALGRMAIETRPAQALERLTAAASAAPERADAAYYLGLALARAGRLEEAEFALRWASQDPGFAHAGLFEAALVVARRGDLSGAARTLSLSLTCGSSDVRTWSLRSALLRALGQVDTAHQAIQAVLEMAPYDRLAAAEAHLCAAALSKPRVAAKRFRELRGLLTPGADPWLELAFDYSAAGLVADAVALLQTARKHVPQVREDPLTHYALAHWLRRLGREEDAKLARSRAPSLPQAYVFAHHWELEPILREAADADPEDGYAWYHLGNLLYSRTRREEALAAWQEAAKRIDDFPVLFRNLATACREVHQDLDQAEAWLRKAVSFAPQEPRSYLELERVLRDRKASPEDRLAVLDAAPGKVQRRGVMAAEQALACMASGEWHRALTLLQTHTFHRWEMEFRMRRIWVDANLGRGCDRLLKGDHAGARADFEAALDYPRNLRIGKPPRREDARAHWCAALACEALGDEPAATAHLEVAAAESHHHAGTEPALYRALALARLGRTEEADKLLAECLKLMDQCAEYAPDDANAQFVFGLALKAAGRAEEAKAALKHALDLNPWLPRARQLLSSTAVL